jgi:all-trans-8'-apo-beta-carotenal 15,15'-oxygenase
MRYDTLMVTRRETIQLMAAGASVAALGPGTLVGAEAPITPGPPPERKWLAKLAESLPTEVDYIAEVEGQLPEGLSGTLYRNGPGLFERNGFRKRTILDGDGMLRATSFADGQARFRSRFVRTAKYQAEQMEGQYLYPTWTTPAPGYLRNIPCIPSRSQAGVTPVLKGGVLYAFDELGFPYGLDPISLDTQRPIDPFEGLAQTGPANYKAHTKTDGRSGDWVLVGERGRTHPDIHVVVKNREGKQTRHIVQRSPRGSAYFHDFFWADPYVVFHLQPALLSPLPMLVGLRTFADSIQWRPEQGSLLFVVDTSGKRGPIIVEAPSSWMWHTLNAYTSGDTIVADFVGYDAPDHFLGPEASFRAIMQGREGTAKSAGTLRRARIDLASKRAHLETIADGRYEFPSVPQARVGLPHRYGYVASNSADDGWFHDGVARIDTESGAQAAFHFGSGHYVGEPFFVPDPSATFDSSAEVDRGWLLAEVLEGRSERSFIAIFDASRISSGPVANVRLHHHLPFSFHGWWQAA